jgi:predicted amidohydrolase YtcJ
LLLLTALASVCPLPTNGQTTADRVFYNGVVLTMSDDLGPARAIATSGDSVLAVGSDEEILSLAGDATRVVDLVGRTIIPGFVDAHTHIFSEAGERGMTIQQAHGIALSNGITTLGNVSTPANIVETMLTFRDEGRLRIRTNLYLALTDFCGEYLGDWYLDYAPTEDRESRLRIAGVKLFVDGGTCGDIATSFEYVSGHGNLWRSQDGLDRLAQHVDQAGYQLAMHAQGDLATEQALNAIAFLDPSGQNPMRHRIEHNSFVRKELLNRYDETAAVAVMFGRFPTCAEVKFQSLSSRYGEKNVTWLQDWRSLLDANPNIHAAWHSDYPYFVINPIEHLASYVTRAQVEDDGTVCEPPAWLAEHAITAYEALAIMTRGAAYALDRDDRIGTLEPGKLADLVILSQDPTAVPPERIIDTEVLSTFIDGSLVFCRPGSERVCGLPVNSEREITIGPATPSLQIFPNPSFGLASVSYVMEQAGRVQISIYDVTGRLAAHLVNRIDASGRHSVTWSGDNIPSGVYVIRMTTSEGVETKTLVHTGFPAPPR